MVRKELARLEEQMMSESSFAEALMIPRERSTENTSPIPLVRKAIVLLRFIASPPLEILLAGFLRNDTPLYHSRAESLCQSMVTGMYGP